VPLFCSIPLFIVFAFSISTQKKTDNVNRHEYSDLAWRTKSPIPMAIYDIMRSFICISLSPYSLLAINCRSSNSNSYAYSYTYSGTYSGTVTRLIVVEVTNGQNRNIIFKLNLVSHAFECIAYYTGLNNIAYYIGLNNIFLYSMACYHKNYVSMHE